MAACFSTVLKAQPNITRLEYYVDNDPGYGNATALAITAGKDVKHVLFNIDLTPLTEGTHFVAIRSKDANGTWSIDNKWLFVKPHTATAADIQPNITRVEYYIDNDPGYNKATLIPSAAGKDLNKLSFTINMAPLYEGLHVAGVRSKDANNAWSLDNHWLFLKPYKVTGPHPQPKITRVEYYIDTDPGYGKGISLNVTPGLDLNNLSFNINLAALPAGVHVAGVRSRDANGAWSLDNHWLFLKPRSAAGGVTQPNIVRVEYYIDKDPGYGKATAITFKPGNDIETLPFLIDMTKIGKGKHVVGVRSMDEKGAWGMDNTYTFTGGTLPVEMLDFNVLAENDDVKVYWRTVVEINSKQFIIERSVDGVKFDDIGTVAAAGYSNGLISYSFTDVNAMQYTGSTLFYRLKQVDNDSRFTVSPVRKIKMGGSANNLKLQVNPVSTQADLIYTAAENGKLTIQLITGAGQLITTRQVTVTTGINYITLNTSAIASGIYIVQAVSAKDRQTVRMMKK